MSKISLCYPRGLRSSHQVFCKLGGEIYSVCMSGVFADDKPIVVGFGSIGG